MDGDDKLKMKIKLKEEDKAPGVWGTEINLKNVDIKVAKKLIGKLKSKKAKEWIKKIK